MLRPASPTRPAKSAAFNTSPHVSTTPTGGFYPCLPCFHKYARPSSAGHKPKTKKRGNVNPNVRDRPAYLNPTHDPPNAAASAHTHVLARDAARSLKKERVSSDTNHFSSGRPIDLRDSSVYATPASPCAALVPATASMPLPMMVLHSISLGLPFLVDLATSSA